MDQNRKPFPWSRRADEARTTPQAEQQSIDVFKGIGNIGESGPQHPKQTTVTVPNDVIHAPKGSTRI